MLAKLKSISLSAREKKLLSILGGVFCVGCVLLLIFSWFLPQYKEKSAKLAELHLDTLELQSKVMTKTDIEHEAKQKLAALEAEQARYNWDVLRGEPLLALSEPLTENNLQLVTLQQGVAEQRGLVWAVPYQVSVKGSYPVIVNYLQHIEEQGKAVQPKRMSLNYTSAEGTTLEQGELLLELELLTLGSVDLSQVSNLAPRLPEGKSDLFEHSVTLPEVQEHLDEEEGRDASTVTTGGQANSEQAERKARYHFPL